MMGGKITKTRKMLAILAATMMAAATAGCSASTQGSSDTGKETGKEVEKEIERETERETEKEEASDATGLQGKGISLATPYLGSVITNQMIEYIEQKPADAEAEASVINTNNDFSQLVSRLEDVVSAGTDGIVLVSVDLGQSLSQLQDVFEPEVLMFGCDSESVEGMRVNATSGSYQVGELIVKYLFDDLMEGEGVVTALTHKPYPGIVKCCGAFDDLTKEHSGIILITEQHISTEQSINDAQDIVKNLLLASPDSDSITVIWAMWNKPATGAAQALQEADRSQVLVAGVDGNGQAVPPVKEGTDLRVTVKQSSEGMAQIVYEQMDRYFKGEEIERGEAYAPATLVTQESVGIQ